jgi:pimeloyl-ACP methyl ester carboxylesterase
MFLIGLEISELKRCLNEFWLARQYKPGEFMSIARLHHRILGPKAGQNAKKPLVFLHGLMGFAANWGKIWPHFQEDRPVLVLDQRGHGRSEKPASGYSPSDYANDLEYLLREIGWEAAHIVGHSMGGRVALRFASLFPERSLSLTMEDSGAGPRPDRVDWIRGLLASVPTPFSDREIAKNFFVENFRDDPMTGSFLHANLETKENGLQDWRFYPPGMIETVETGRAVDAMEEFSSLTLPTLVVRGGYSREFPSDEAKRMAEARPSVAFRQIEGAGHFVHAQKPEEFSQALKDFLRQAESR